MANDIYEITQMIQNKKVIQNDLNEAFSVISTMFQDRYINKLRSAIEEKQLEHQNNPSREIILLNSLKPFFSKSQHKSLDNAISALHMLQTLQTIKDNSNAFSNGPFSNAPFSNAPFTNVPNDISIDPSIHEDGIYDVDGDCILNLDSCGSGVLNALLVVALANARNFS